MDNQSTWRIRIRSLKELNSLKLFLGTFLVYVFFNNGLYWDSASERTRYVQIKAIVEDNVLYIDRFVPTFLRNDMWDLVLAPSGHFYPNKPPGLTFLGVPVLFITKVLGIPYPLDGIILISLTCVFTSATVTLLYLLCVNSLGMSEKTGLLVSSIYGFATFAFPHAVTLYANSFSAFFVLSAVYFLISRNKDEDVKNQMIRYLLSGTLAGYLLLLDYSNVVFFLPFIGYILFRENRRLVFSFILPAILWLLVLLTYHYVCFGSPFVTTYTYAIYPKNAFDWSYSRPLHLGLLRFLLTPRRGLFFYSSVLLFSIPGFILMIRDSQDRKEGILFLSSFLIILFFFAPLAYSSGYVFGSRRLDPVLPLLCIPIGRILTDPRKIFFGEYLQNNSIVKKYGVYAFWTVFSLLTFVSIAVNGLGALTNVHPTNVEYLDYNLRLLFAGQIHSFVWNISPLLGFAIILPAIILISSTLYKVYQKPLSTLNLRSP
ncbi:hypothetical protein [Candidatus Borrarchaeum sp.]|uniref:hypothetical protein n=1 Tax=Candidatus Borrarchaeum sp. TaxID=2846742 RepID=UPI002580B873|nr:hypothetical protein [Candidatus Borrarchaeum sp.]